MSSIIGDIDVGLEFVTGVVGAMTGVEADDDSRRSETRDFGVNAI